MRRSLAGSSIGFFLGLLAGLTVAACATDVPIDGACFDDPDQDGIESADEGTEDPDRDGLPNWRDPDSDGNGIPDREEAGDLDCSTPPSDLDGDGRPGIVDTDANGDGFPDEPGVDRDEDGVPDWRDLDVDQDGIDNLTESPGEELQDTDRDGVPDVWDEDSDGDSIRDLHERAVDYDRDGLGAFRDLDSDGDTIPDAEEAGDADPSTPPVACPLEIDPSDPSTQAGDSLPDFIDADSDNDGAGDGDERRFGSDPCDPNTDGDAFGDLVEVAYTRVNCPRGNLDACDCAANPSCGIPDEDFYLVLPFGEERDEILAFQTTLRRADVFFLVDTTESMGSTVRSIQETLTTPSNGLIDQIRGELEDPWFGGGAHQDFPVSPFGASTDRPFELVVGVTPATLPGMSPGTGLTVLQRAFDRLTLGNGGDGPESHIEALYQVVTGEGGAFTAGERAWTIPEYRADCLGRGFGAPCFRDGAVPIVVHFTDVCAHGGPPGEAEECGGYDRIEPPPRSWAVVTDALRGRGARFIGVNTASMAECEVRPEPNGLAPCHYLHETARATGSVDVAGDPLVFDLPPDVETRVFVATVRAAVRRLVERVPLDVTTVVRDDAVDELDATRFVGAVAPACDDGECYRPRSGVPRSEAVARVTATGFEGVLPGTEVDFRVRFQNDEVEQTTALQVYVAFIDVVGDERFVLDTRQVYVVIPAVPTFVF